MKMHDKYRQKLYGILSFFLIGFLFSFQSVGCAVYSETAALSTSVELSIHSGSACLMDRESGEVLYEHNADVPLEPASVTKVMTLLLAMEDLDSGKIALDTKISASMNAAGMGGSQIWLEYGEELTLDEMLKAIVVVSANDCTVALAEHLAGSEEAFVDRMNGRAAELGMTGTCFKNCTGLPCEGHLTTARDIAVMTRELAKHGTVFNYTTIWMDSLRGGSLGLSNTNKLIRFYKGATGMKTGFTSSAGYCLAATAERDGLGLIASVMNGKTSDERFEDAKKLLDFGFANFRTVSLPAHALEDLPVKGGENGSVPVRYDDLTVLLPKGRGEKTEESVFLPDFIEAPVKAGDKVGHVVYSIGGEVVGEADVVASEDCRKADYGNILSKIFKKLMMLR